MSKTITLADESNVVHFERGPRFCLKCFLVGIWVEMGPDCPFHPPDPTIVPGTVTITGITRTPRTTNR